MSPIRVLTEFPGASLGDVKQEENVIFATLREEPLVKKDGTIHDYNWHFVFGLENASDDPQECEVYINVAKKERELLQNTAHIYSSESFSDDFSMSSFEALTDTFRKYFIKVHLEAKQTLYLSNTYPRNLEFLYTVFTNTSQLAPAKMRSIGKSVEGRDLIAYEYSSDAIAIEHSSKPLVFITSGFHPMEADTFASQALMEYLAGDGRELLREFNFVFVPVVNPDGFYYGFNGCNAKGVNLYWDFRRNDQKNAPETYYLWKYVKTIKPCVYIDFHAYTFQLRRKLACPYLKPLLFYRGRKVKKLVDQINRSLVPLHEGRYAKGAMTYTPSALAFHITQEFNTITYAKYHLHTMEGKAVLASTAKDIVCTICEELQRRKITDRSMILLRPYGKVPPSFNESIMVWALIAWDFYVKPVVRFIVGRRKKKDEKK